MMIDGIEFSFGTLEGDAAKLVGKTIEDVRFAPDETGNTCLAIRCTDGTEVVLSDVASYTFLNDLS